jgi:uncharacterized protein YndB with AHSA1/START domain
MTTVTVAEVTLDIDARPAEVFGYLTDPARYVRWMGSSAVLEARPGGRYEVAMSDGFRAAGTFIAVSPPHQVAFTWGFAMAWETYLPRLAAVAAGVDPGPDPHSAS